MIPTVRWFEETGPRPPRPGPDEIHLWGTGRDGTRRPGRAFVRRVLAVYLGLAPGDVPLRAGPGGAPRIDDRANPAGLRFSLTRSGPRVLLAVASGGAVGVDSEAPLPEASWSRVPERCFTPRERGELRALPPEARPTAFAEIWTRKEAAGKALGSGLVPEVLTLDLGPAGRGAVECPGGPTVWSIPGTAPAAAALARMPGAAG